MTSGKKFRRRIILTASMLLVLLAVRGTPGMWLLYQLGDRIDAVLRDNYDNVVAMHDLQEGLERIDSSFQSMFIAQGLNDPGDRGALESQARASFEDSWFRYHEALGKKRANITIHPAEDSLVERLTELTRRYHTQGQNFYQRATSGSIRYQDYSGESGPHETFLEIKQVADNILQLHRREMKLAAKAARRDADASLGWLSMGLACAVGLVVSTLRQSVHPSEQDEAPDDACTS